MKPGTRIFAIDPGRDKSGLTMYQHGKEWPIVEATVMANEELLARLWTHKPWDVYKVGVIEEMRGFMRRAGSDIFTTCEWIGKFDLMWKLTRSQPIGRLGRKDVCLHICGTARANDADIRGAIIERYGGSRQIAMGTKKTPGPLYGVISHAMQALALAITWAETL